MFNLERAFWKHINLRNFNMRLIIYIFFTLYNKYSLKISILFYTLHEKVFFLLCTYSFNYFKVIDYIYIKPNFLNFVIFKISHEMNGISSKSYLVV